LRRSLLDKINEQISHLSDDRVRRSKKKIDAALRHEIATAVEGEIARFLQNLTTDYDKICKIVPRNPSTIRADFGGTSSTVTTAVSTVVGVDNLKK
jgi:hypothetical protein